MNSSKKLIIDFRSKNPDLIRYRNNKIVFLALKNLIVWSIVTIACLISCERTYLIPLSMAAGVIITILLLKKSRLTCGGWSGVIESIKVETRRVKSEGKVVASGRYTSMHDQNFIVCTVLTDKGKQKTFMLPEEYGKVYRIGDTVLSITGIDYKIDLSNKEMTVCPKCGSIYPRTQKECISVGCHMPIINI